jgi:hypothetical protein
MAQLKTGTFCWADPGLDFSKPMVRQSLQRPINNHFCSARSAFSSSTLPEDGALYGSSNATGYQPGGTFMTTTDRWATRSTGKPLVDPTGLGRWSGLCFLGKKVNDWLFSQHTAVLANNLLADSVSMTNNTLYYWQKEKKTKCSQTVYH